MSENTLAQTYLNIHICLENPDPLHSEPGDITHFEVLTWILPRHSMCNLCRLQENPPGIQA